MGIINAAEVISKDILDLRSFKENELEFCMIDNKSVIASKISSRDFVYFS